MPSATTSASAPTSGAASTPPPCPMLSFGPDGRVKAITDEFAALLEPLEGEIHVVSVYGVGRAGKSTICTALLRQWDPSSTVTFASAPSHKPVTNGIDACVIEHSGGKGHLIILDCEGTDNGQQQAHPFVAGLACLCSSTVLVTESGAFTTERGLRSLTKLLNSRAIVSASPDQNPRLILIENMSVSYASVSNQQRHTDLLADDPTTPELNTIRGAVRDSFTSSFHMMPYRCPGSKFDEEIEKLADSVARGTHAASVGGKTLSGSELVAFARTLIADIAKGADEFDRSGAATIMVEQFCRAKQAELLAKVDEELVAEKMDLPSISGKEELALLERKVNEKLETMVQRPFETFASKLIPPATVEDQRASLEQVVNDRVSAIKKQWDHMNEVVKSSSTTRQVAGAEQKRIVNSWMGPEERLLFIYLGRREYRTWEVKQEIEQYCDEVAEKRNGEKTTTKTTKLPSIFNTHQYSEYMYHAAALNDQPWTRC